MGLYCEKCGAELKPEWRFCIKCGATLPAVLVSKAQAPHLVTVPAPEQNASREPKKNSWLKSLFPSKDTPQEALEGVRRSPGKMGGSERLGRVEAGEEVTEIFDGPGAMPDFYDADDQTVVLDEAPKVALVRQKTAETLTAPLPFVVGKGSAADVQISGNPTVSRRHARFYVQDCKVFVADLGSTNKTKVNGVEVASDSPVEIADGDDLKLSDEQFCVRVQWD